MLACKHKIENMITSDQNHDNQDQPEEPESIQSKGGKARAKKLSGERLKSIASDAALSRWVPKAQYGSLESPLIIGNLEIPCYVLDDGRRVITQGGVLTALTMSQGTATKGGGDRISNFVGTKAINPFVTKKLDDMITNVIKFKVQGTIAYGYDATILPEICDAVLEARKTGSLNYQQEHIAAQCEMLLRAFARVGIVALVDEATGYQEVRSREALQSLLDAFLKQEFAAWAKRFPDEFYKELFRLRGWEWNRLSVKRPILVGKLTNSIVYERLAPGVLTELESRNPKDDQGRRPVRHHQWLSDHIGHPALAQHLHAVIGFMRASTSWTQFIGLLDMAFPKRGSVMQMELFDDPI